MSLIGPGKRIGFAVSACHGESTRDGGVGSVCSPCPAVRAQAPIRLGGRYLKPEATHCVKASVCACAFLVVTWHGDPCLDWQPLLETRSSNIYPARNSRSTGSGLGQRDPVSCRKPELSMTSRGLPLSFSRSR